MKLLMIIDSLELNGGSTMFMEMYNGFRKYYPEIEISPLVVSKTGKYGRSELTHQSMMASYGVQIPSISYENFEKRSSQFYDKNTIILHHRLQCTYPLRVKCPYIVINHTVQSPERMKKFNKSNLIISVCNYVRAVTSQVKSAVILNGVENDYIESVPSEKLEGDFKTGRCQRLGSSKFSEESLKQIENWPINNHRHYLMGPWGGSSVSTRLKKYPSVTHLGSVFDRHKKIAVLKSLNLYYYDSTLKEGASIAILEALACGIPVFCNPCGGTPELVIDELNGYHIRGPEFTKELIVRLSKDSELLNNLKKKTIEDFNNRLHIKHMLEKYMNFLRNF